MTDNTLRDELVEVLMRKFTYPREYIEKVLADAILPWVEAREERLRADVERLREYVSEREREIGAVILAESERDDARADRLAALVKVERARFALGAPEDDWRWNDRRLRQQLRAALADPPQGASDGLD